MYLILSAVIVIGVYWLMGQLQGKETENLPPTPRFALPVLGHLHLVGKSPHVTFSQWAKAYGSIFRVQLGQISLVVVNDIKTIREVLLDSRFDGRPDIPTLNLISGGQRGIVNNQGRAWSELRKFTTMNLKDLGMGQKSMDCIIQEEIAHVLQYLGQQEGSFLLQPKVFMVPVVNVLWSLTTGQRFDHEDFSLTDKIQQVLSTSANSILLFYPSLARKSMGFFGQKQSVNLANFFKDYQHRLIREHRSSLNISQPRDLIDIFLIASASELDESSSLHAKNIEPELIAVLNDLLLGGSETTATALTWIILCVATHPICQKNLHDEIDQVVGPDSVPSINNRPDMPYTIAVIMEALRLTTLFPLGAFHSATEDVRLRDYHIPKNSIIALNLWAAHHDTEVWQQPGNFIPDRFIQITAEGGRSLKRSLSSVPFSLGKRSCLGELLAKEQLFLFTVSIFQKFRIQLHQPGQCPMDFLGPQPGVMSIPPPFHVKVFPR